MQKIIKRYICVLMVLATMMGYGQSTINYESVDGAYRTAVESLMRSSKTELEKAEGMKILLSWKEDLYKQISEQAAGEMSSFIDKYKTVLIAPYYEALLTKALSQGYDYKIYENRNYTFTGLTGESHTGTITFFKHPSDENLNFFYFTPNSTDNEFIAGVRYPIVNGSTTPTNPTNPTTPTNYYTFIANPIGTTMNSPGVTNPMVFSFSGAPTGTPSTSTAAPTLNKPTINTTIWFFDNDHDGWYGTTQQSSTSPGAGWSNNRGAGLDCNDNDPTRTSDCSGGTMKGWFLDNDHDGYHADVLGAISSPTPGNWTNNTFGPDYDDNDAAINICQTPWFLDNDHDGYHVAVIVATTNNPNPNIYISSTKGLDCDDDDITKTMNCVNTIKIKWYLDKDGDRWYEKSSLPVESVNNPGAYYIKNAFGKDCDDTNKDITNHCYNFYYIDNDGDGWDSGMVADIDDNGGKYKVTSNGRDCDDTPATGINVHILNKCRKCEAEPVNGICGGKDCDQILNGNSLSGETLAGIVGWKETKKGTTKDQINKIAEFINQFAAAYGVNSPELRFHFYTQIAAETGGLTKLGEKPSMYASSKFKYKGRGILQLTGRRNYQAFQDYLITKNYNFDIMSNPDLLINNMELAVLSALWYWDKGNNVKQYATDYENTAILNVSKQINCGSISSECGGNPNGYPNGWKDRKENAKRLKDCIN